MAIEPVLPFSAERLAHWAKCHVSGRQGDSEEWPGTGYEHIFHDRNVLEIGPGDGRQTKHGAPIARSWATADIISANNPNHVFLSYDADLGARFDVIAFWHVIHHVKHAELPAFARFVVRHVHRDGYVIFNSALHVPPGSCGDDGMKTTVHEDGDIQRAFHAATRDVCAGTEFVDDIYPEPVPHKNWLVHLCPNPLPGGEREVIVEV